MIIAGIVLAVLGYLLGVSLLLWLGVALLIIGAILALIGRTHPVYGRRHYW